MKKVTLLISAFLLFTLTCVNHSAGAFRNERKIRQNAESHQTDGYVLSDIKRKS